MIYGIIWLITICGFALIGVALKTPGGLLGIFGAFAGTMAAKFIGERILQTAAGRKVETVLTKLRLPIMSISVPVSLFCMYQTLIAHIYGDEMFAVTLASVLISVTCLYSYTLPKGFFRP